MRSLPPSPYIFILLATCGVALLLLPSTCAQTANTRILQGLIQPSGVAVDASSNIVYVTDPNANRILKLAANNTLLAVFTGPNAQFKPFGVALDSSGALYVTEQSNNRILKMSPNGTVIATIGDSVSPALGSIAGITIDSAQQIYVCETQNNRILKFDQNGDLSQTFALSVSINPPYPYSVAVDTSGYVYVTNLGVGYNNFAKFASNGTQIATYRFSGFYNNPVGIVVDGNGNLFVSDSLNNVVYKMSASTGAALGILSQPTENYNRPTLMAIDLSANLYVVDQSNARVVKVASDGTQLAIYDATMPSIPIAGLAVDSSGNNLYMTSGSSFYKVTTSNGQPSYSQLNYNYGAGPQAVALDSSGYIYLAQSTLGVVQLGPNFATFDPIFTLSSPSFQASNVAVDSSGNVYATDDVNGRLVKFYSNRTLAALVNTTITGTYSGSPTGVTVDNAGNVYIIDNDNRLIRFTTDLTQRFIFSNVFLYQPTAITVDLQGNIYIANTGTSNVVQLSNEGALLNTFTSANPSLTNPSAIAVDNNGNLYVGDNNRRVVIFSGVVPIPSSTSSSTAASSGAAATGLSSVTSSTIVMATSSSAVNTCSSSCGAEETGSSMSSAALSGFIVGIVVAFLGGIVFGALGLYFWTGQAYGKKNNYGLELNNLKPNDQ